MHSVFSPHRATLLQAASSVYGLAIRTPSVADLTKFNRFIDTEDLSASQETVPGGALYADVAFNKFSRARHSTTQLNGAVGGGAGGGAGAGVGVGGGMRKKRFHPRPMHTASSPGWVAANSKDDPNSSASATEGGGGGGEGGGGGGGGAYDSNGGSGGGGGGGGGDSGGSAPPSPDKPVRASTISVVSDYSFGASTAVNRPTDRGDSVRTGFTSRVR
jgi:hypothetical protein